MTKHTRPLHWQWVRTTRLLRKPSPRTTSLCSEPLLAGLATNCGGLKDKARFADEAEIKAALSVLAAGADRQILLFGAGLTPAQNAEERATQMAVARAAHGRLIKFDNTTHTAAGYARITSRHAIDCKHPTVMWRRPRWPSWTRGAASPPRRPSPPLRWLLYRR